MLLSKTKTFMLLVRAKIIVKKDYGTKQRKYYLTMLENGQHICFLFILTNKSLIK